MAHMNDTSSKKGRGRPAGSTSFVRINISDLIDAVGKNARIVVSKKWLEEIGLTIESPAPKLIATQAPVAEEPKIDFVITNFED